MTSWENISSVIVKQKTAYEMRISDWSSDVCSSDLAITSVTVTIDAGTLELGAGAPGGSSLSLAGGVYTLIVANPDDYADAIAALQVEVPAGYEGTVNGTIAQYPGAKPKRARPHRSAQLLLIHDHEGDRKSTRLNSSH